LKTREPKTKNKTKKAPGASITQWPPEALLNCKHYPEFYTLKNTIIFTGTNTTRIQPDGEEENQD